jgi:hypothetical protein
MVMKMRVLSVFGHCQQGETLIMTSQIYFFTLQCDAPQTQGVQHRHLLYMHSYVYKSGSGFVVVEIKLA